MALRLSDFLKENKVESAEAGQPMRLSEFIGAAKPMRLSEFTGEKRPKLFGDVIKKKERKPEEWILKGLEDSVKQIVTKPISTFFEAGKQIPRAIMGTVEALQKGESVPEQLKRGALKLNTRDVTEVAHQIGERLYGKVSTNMWWEATKQLPFATAGEVTKLFADPALFFTFKGINQAIRNPYVAKYLGKPIPAPKWFDKAISQAVKFSHRPFKTMAEGVKENRINKIVDELYKNLGTKLTENYININKTPPPTGEIKAMIKAKLIEQGVYGKSFVELQSAIKKSVKIKPKTDIKPDVPRETLAIEKPDIAKKVQPEPILQSKQGIVEAIPKFKSTQEALAFGAKATPSQLNALKIKQKEIAGKVAEIKKTPADKQTDQQIEAGYNLAVEGGLYREAIDAAEGRISPEEVGKLTKSLITKESKKVKKPMPVTRKEVDSFGSPRFDTEEEAAQWMLDVGFEKKWFHVTKRTDTKFSTEKVIKISWGANPNRNYMDEIIKKGQQQAQKKKATPIKESADPLIEEAKKHDTVEGFVEAKLGKKELTTEGILTENEENVELLNAVIKLMKGKEAKGISQAFQLEELKNQDLLENSKFQKLMANFIGIFNKEKHGEYFTSDILEELREGKTFFDEAQGVFDYLIDNTNFERHFNSTIQKISRETKIGREAKDILEIDERKKFYIDIWNKAHEKPTEAITPPEKPPKKPPVAEGFEEEGRKKKIEIEKRKVEEVNKFSAELKSIDKQMRLLENTKKRLKGKGFSTKAIDNQLKNLSKKFVYIDSQIADLVITPVSLEKIKADIGAEARQKQLMAINDISEKMAIPLAPEKVKPIIQKQVGITKKVEKISIKEDVALRHQLKKEVAGSKAGFVEGKKVQKRKDKIKEMVKKLNRLIKNQEKVDLALEIESISGGHYESDSSALNEHLTYFQSLQLPEGSKVKGIKRALSAIARLKASGKIDPKYANKQIRRLRKDLMYQAHKEGIAIRMTKGGKIMLAIRESGVYVPKKFAEYKNFKDVDLIAGGQTDTTRMIQEMDGALTGKQKEGIEGQAGPLEQNVGWVTRKIQVQKLSFIKEQETIVTEILQGIRKNSKKSQQIVDVLREINTEDTSFPFEGSTSTHLIQARNQHAKELLQRENIKAVTNDIDIVNKAIEARKFFNAIREHQNIARNMRHQEEIKYRQTYSPEIIRDTTIWEMFGDVGKTPKEALGEKVLPDYIHHLNAPFNARAKAREFGIKYEDRVNCAVDLMEKYIATAAKDIFNTSIIQNNKAYIQQLETMGFSKSAQSLASWTSEAYAGMTPKIDRVMNIPPKFSFSKPLTTLINKRGMRYFNHLRNLGVFPLNFAWNTTTQPSSIDLTIMKYGYIRTFLGLMKWFNPRIRKETAQIYYSYIIKAYKAGKLTRQDATGLLGGDIKIYKSVPEIIENYANIIGDTMEKILTGASIQAAKMHGKGKGLTGEALIQYASDGGGKTQSMYNLEDKPGILRNLVVQTATPYQTFAYEVKSTIKEWAGKTGTPPDDQKERILQLFRFISAVIVTSYLTMKAGKKVWDFTGRPPLPFAEIWLTPVIKKITGEYTDVKYAVPAPVQTGMAFVEGIDRVLERGDWRKLRNELIRWGPGTLKIPGGVFWSRIVDGAIAYAEGGIYDKSGKPMFKVETNEDIARAMFAGVWSTKEGQDYLNKRKKKMSFNMNEMIENILGKGPEERQKTAKEKRKAKRKAKTTQKPTFIKPKNRKTIFIK